MDKEACLQFALALGIDDAYISDIDRDEGTAWIRGTCPLPWLHEAGRDRHPSFGIFASPKTVSYYNCFAHGGGELAKLVHTLQWRYEVRLARATEILTTYEIMEDEDGIHFTEYKDSYEEEAPKNVQFIPDLVLDLYPPILGRATRASKKVKSYLNNERRISDATLAHFDIRYDPSRDSVVFPVRDAHGRLCALRCRVAGTKQIYEISPEEVGMSGVEFPSLSSGAMFGAHVVAFHSHVMVVEAEIEAMTIHSLGFENVIAACGSLSHAQAAELVYPYMFFGFDWDKAGKKSTRRAYEACRGQSILYLLKWNEVDGASDPGDMRTREDLDLVIARRIMLPP